METNKPKQIKQELENQSQERLKHMSTIEKKLICKKERIKNILLCTFCILFLGFIDVFIFWYHKHYDKANHFLIVIEIIFLLAVLYFSVCLIFQLASSKDRIALRLIKREIKPLLKETLKINDISFKATRIIKTPDSLGITKIFIIDDKARKFVYKKGFTYSEVYDFSDVLECNIFEKNCQQLQSAANSAAIGGLLFGTTGAIIGSSVSRKIEDINSGLSVLICLKDEKNPLINIEYIKIGSSYDMNNLQYLQKKSSAQQLYNEISQFIEIKNVSYVNNNVKAEAQSKKSNKEQLQELKEMLDDGLITQEDFEQKKKQILGL